MSGIAKLVKAIVSEKGKMNIPNALSAVRIILALFVLCLIINGNIHIAAFLFVFAAATDFLDGFIARAYKQKTRLGKFLDLLADRILILFPLPILMGRGLHWGIVIIIYVVEIGAVAGLLLIINTKREKEISLAWLGKIKTFSQYIGVPYAILGWQYFNEVMWAVAALTALSGLNYFLKFRKVLKNNDSLS